MSGNLYEVVGAVPFGHRIPTGSTLLDLMLGGGFALGRFSIISGMESTGKTQLAVETATNFRMKFPEGRVLYLESEGAFDPDYYVSMGMPVEDFEFEHVETVQQMKRIVSNLLGESDGLVPVLVVVDSIDALSDETEMENMEKNSEKSYNLGKQKFLSSFFRTVGHQIAKKKICLLGISQLRYNLGNPYNPYTRTGGKALDFHASHIINLTKSGTIKRSVDGKERIVGITVTAASRKNKLNTTVWSSVKYHIIHGYGIDDVLSCLEFLSEEKALDRLGFSYKRVGDIRKAIARMDGRERQEAIDLVRRTVTEYWSEVCSKVLPVERKYGNEEPEG